MSQAEKRKTAVKKLRLLAYNSKCDIHVFRTKIEEAFYAPFLPNHVENNEHTYGGVQCDVLVPEIHSSRRVMLYVHGGSFVAGSRASYRSFCATLANRALSRVVVPEYRLAPAHPFPAAIEDVQTTFRALFTDEQITHHLLPHDGAESKKNESDPQIIIAADGAGASIALALVLNLRERYRKCIRRIALFSPWLNLNGAAPLKNGKKTNDGIISGECVRQSAEAYAGQSRLDNPLISPLFAAPDLLADFPPVYMQFGGAEILLPDAERFAALLKEGGSECRIDVWNGMMHLFQMADDYLDEAHEALDAFAKIICGTENAGFERQRFENKPRLERSLNAEA